MNFHDKLESGRTLLLQPTVYRAVDVISHEGARDLTGLSQRTSFGTH